MPRGHDSAFTRVTLFCAALAMPGCTSLSTTVGMQPVLPANSGDTYRNGQALYLALDGLELSVSPGRQQVVRDWIGPLLLPPIIPTGSGKDPLPSPGPFPIELRLYAWKDGFTFDPMSVELTTAEGRTLRPMAYTGPCHDTAYPGLDPAFRRRYPCACWPAYMGDLEKLPREGKDWTIYPSGETKRPKSTESRLGRKGISCFWLFFDTPVRYDTEMQLSIAGLKRGGSRVTVPAYTLRKGRFKTFGTVP